MLGQKQKKRQSGFTLIELLVVLAIICMLAAILFPVFVRVRQKARESSCASNLKQLGLAILQYSQDYDERYPLSYIGPSSTSVDPTLTLVAVLAPYIKNDQIWVCPDRLALDRGTLRFGSGGSYRNKVADYGYNERVFGGYFNGTLVSVPLSAIEYPVTQIMLADNMKVKYYNPTASDVETSGSTGYPHIEKWVDSNDGWETGLQPSHVRANVPRLYFPFTVVTSPVFQVIGGINNGGKMLAPRHSNYSANVVYGDGHVKLRNVREVYSRGCGNPLSEWCNNK